MDHQNLDLESRQSSSFRQLSGVGSSRRRSLSTFSLELQFDDNIGSDAASEAGDIGYRALHSNRTSISGRSHFSLDNLPSSGVVVPLQENGTSIPVAPSTLNNISVAVNAAIQSEERKDEEEEVPWLLEYTTCLLSLAVFGILGF